MAKRRTGNSDQLQVRRRVPPAKAQHKRNRASLQRLKPVSSRSTKAGLKPGPPKTRSASRSTAKAENAENPKMKSQPARAGVALVTGGAGSMGTTICQALAREGMRVVVGYNRSAEKAKALVASLAGEGH